MSKESMEVHLQYLQHKDHFCTMKDGFGQSIEFIDKMPLRYLEIKLRDLEFLLSAKQTGLSWRKIFDSCYDLFLPQS